MKINEVKKLSKFLSLILRHQPQRINLKLDKGGWADVEELISKGQSRGMKLDFDMLQFIVENNDKKRFSFSPDFKKIRANQGHSVDIDLGLLPKEPPFILFHGTAIQNIDSIKKNGLVKGKRQHVHLSTDKETAHKVGMRHGTPVVLKVDSYQMEQDGFKFYLSENGVWLTDKVERQYIDFYD